ncbi:carboxypeptidase regulatory-like domain-containing protein, partial [Acidobacteria bacterium AH-259-D05]|nr:carboxypeptidase regulatory-like domain-containing protein [Acidobacteria bacterium AH-259-D05]
MMYREWFVVTFVVIFAFAGIYAQQTTGIISGTVADETGGVLPGVEVTARNTETGLTRTAISDDEGRYRLAQLAPGTYELVAELTGFQTALVQGISLSMAQEAVIAVTLRVGEITEQVIVSAEVSLVETTSANVGALVDTQTIQDLPLNGRDFIQLAALQEGVVIPTSANASRTGDTGVKMTISGTRPNQTAILLDGTDIKNYYGNTPGGIAGALLGVDTVREFRVITNAYSAEYGRFTGGVISAVTKSGTNEIHGTVFEFHRNSALDARNFFDRDSKNPLERTDPPNFIRNQFGFTVGGPIQEDQTFFFGSYEGLRQRLTTTFIDIVPDEDAHNGVIPKVFSRRSRKFECPRDNFGNRRAEETADGLCLVGVAPEIQPYLELFPRANGEIFQPRDGTGEFLFPAPSPLNENYFVVKVDHQLSDSDSF